MCFTLLLQIEYVYGGVAHPDLQSSVAERKSCTGLQKNELDQDGSNEVTRFGNQTKTSFRLYI